MIARTATCIFFVCLSSMICAVDSTAQNPDDIYWEPGPGVLNEGGRVNTMLLDHFHDLLIVAGSFSSVDGIPANNIAAWDGTGWSALGNGTDGPVNALTVWSGLLFAGGEFTTAGGDPANNIAYWDGAAWHPMGEGVHVVSALEDWDGRIYAAHYIPDLDHQGSSYLSAWDFSTWTTVGYFYLDHFMYYFPRSCVTDLQIFGQRLNALGNFGKVSPGAIDASGIAAWDGAAWSALPPNHMDTEKAIWHEGDLVTAGWNSIGFFDGFDWTDIWEAGPVMWDDYFRALAVYDGNIVASGDIGSFEQGIFYRIMEWDGSEWSSLGSDLDAPALALCVYDGKLVAGGSFTIAGGKPCSGLAAWTRHTTSVMITAFHASQAENCVELTWSLGSGERMEGFRIYRTGRDGGETLLNGELLAPDTRSYVDGTVLPGERYLYTLAVVGAESGEVRSFSVEAGIPPLSLDLSQNHPNPFNPSTTISFTVPEPAHVTLRVYSPAGRLVRTLVDGFEQAGVQEIEWDGTGDSGRRAASGVYFYRLRVGKETLSRKMTLLR